MGTELNAKPHYLILDGLRAGLLFWLYFFICSKLIRPATWIR